MTRKSTSIGHPFLLSIHAIITSLCGTDKGQTQAIFTTAPYNGLHAQSNSQQTKCEDTSLFPPLARVQNTNNSAWHGTVNRLLFESASFYGAFN